MTQRDDPLVAMMMAARDAQAALALEQESVRESAEYQEALASIRNTVVGLFKTLNLCEFAATRWPAYQERYLFPRHVDDIGEAALAAQLAIENGALNATRRELRYMLEVAVNTAFVDEAASEQDLDGRLSFYRSNAVKKQNVDHVRDLPLRMLSESRGEFMNETLRAWVRSSNYVHLTKPRIDEKIRLRAEGVRLGFETPEMVATVAAEVHEVCSIIIVLAFETIGPAFTGDILVTGGLDCYEAWPFHANRFVAAVDAHFDYKQERQASLPDHIRRRERRLRRLSGDHA